MTDKLLFFFHCTPPTSHRADITPLAMEYPGGGRDKEREKKGKAERRKEQVGLSLLLRTSGGHGLCAHGCACHVVAAC